MKYESQTLAYGNGAQIAAQRHCTFRHQHGFALVEMMIAMAIAIFLLLGLGAILYSTHETYSAQTGLSQLQDNERVAMSIVANTIQSAGYFTNPTVQTAAGVFLASPPYGAPQVINGWGSGSRGTPD